MNRYLIACMLALGAGMASAQLPTTIEVPPGQLAPADVDFLRTADTANVDQLTFAMRVTGRVRVSEARMDLERLDAGVTRSSDVVVLDPVNPKRQASTGTFTVA